MSFYVAYAALIGHVALGAAQFEKGSSLLIALTVGAVWLSVLHIAAMLKGVAWILTRRKKAAGLERCLFTSL